jgi:hypothetical protein
MSQLKKILIDYQNGLRNTVTAGGETESAPMAKADFILQLKLISGRNRVFLWINIGMLLVVFLGSILLIYHFINDLDALPKIFGASGLSISGMIFYMTHLWRQIVAIDMTIALADRLDSKTLPAIIKSLLSIIDRSGRKKKR